MSWVGAPKQQHKCEFPPIEGREIGEFWVCDECQRGWPVARSVVDNQLIFGCIPYEPSLWKFATRESRSRKWWELWRT